MPLFTVIMPTHDHVESVRYAAESVLAQSVADLELRIVGDGAPPRTRELVAELSAADPRVRYFEFPKGERHGERHRHQVLQDAQSDFVAYQADDDLWLPDHLEALADLLGNADFAHTMQVWVDRNGGVVGSFADLSSASVRAGLAPRRRSVGFNSVGHRLAAYRRLPFGWRPTPAGIATDHFMWCQFFAETGCGFASSVWPTALHFSSVERTGWSVAQRAAELVAFRVRLQDPREALRIRRAAQSPLVKETLSFSSQRLELLQACASGAGAAAAAAFLLAPGVRIGFDQSGGGGVLLLSGFCAPEDWGVWSEDDRARVLLVFAADCPERVRLVFRLHRLLGGPSPRGRGTLCIGDQAPVTLDLADPCEVTTLLDRGGQRLLTALFTIENPLSPARLGLSADPRQLGVGLMELRCETAGPAPL